MSNVAGKAYAMNVITPMRPSLTWINRFAFMISRGFPATLRGLLGLGLIHFARWVIIRRDQWPDRGQPKHNLVNDYMLFCSNFNGTWDQYIDAFADGIPSGLDLLWYSSTKFPHSIPITPFKNYIRANQIDTAYYYNATPGSAQRDVKVALQLVAGLRAIDAGSLDDAELGAAYDALLKTMQWGMGVPGYAPVASCDTAAADNNRREAVLQRWGPRGKGVPAAVQKDRAVPDETVPASAAADGAGVAAAVEHEIDALPEIAKPPSPPPSEPGDQPIIAKPTDAENDKGGNGNA